MMPNLDPGLGPSACVERPRILVVDDEPHVIDGLRRTLFERFDVQGVTSGQEALHVLADQQLPVALVDLALPGMHGVALLERMREAAPHTTRIVHTGQVNLVHALASINQGSVFRFLVKPSQPTALIGALTEAVEQHRLASQDVALMAARLRDLSGQLVQAERLATLGTMSAAIGHEIGNLAAAFGSIYDIMKERSEANHAPTEEELSMLAMVREHLERHTGHLRRLSLPREEREETIDAASVCGETVRLMSQLGVLHGCQIAVDLPSYAVPIRFDRTRLEQVVINLLKNAIEAVAEVDGDRRVCLSVRTDVEGSAAEITVRDNGHGITAAQLPRVFEPYFTTKGAGGTGLGLPVIRQVVEQRGGRVTCTSVPHEGTTFAVRLPVAMQTAS